jgi:hypothetical protein
VAFAAQPDSRFVAVRLLMQDADRRTRIMSLLSGDELLQRLHAALPSGLQQLEHSNFFAGPCLY